MPRRDKHRPAPRSESRKEPPRPARLPAASTSADRLCWRFSHTDHDGPWCFHELDSADLCRVLTQLAGFESMTAAEAFGGSPGKDYEVEHIPNRRARDRLVSLGLADQTVISRFRLSGRERLYGFRLDNVFHVVWWDPRHEVWPSEKRNT
jgi:hypothetical protein